MLCRSEAAVHQNEENKSHVLSLGTFCHLEMMLVLLTQGHISNKSIYVIPGYLFLVSKHFRWTQHPRRDASDRQQVTVMLPLSHQGAARFFNLLSLCTSYNWSLTIRIICPLWFCSCSVQKVAELLILWSGREEKSVTNQIWKNTFLWVIKDKSQAVSNLTLFISDLWNCSQTMCTATRSSCENGRVVMWGDYTQTICFS